jgi:CRISPR-associated endonuclease/helicase Cas3
MVKSKLDTLYAKSQSSKDGADPARSLLQHTMDVVKCTESLFKVSGDSMLEAFRLDPDKWRDRLRRDWWLAAWLHDLGKANNQFQSMLRRERRNPQAIRHEALSYWIATQEEIRSWLGQLVPDSQELTLIFWAVAGHHRKFTGEVDTQQGTGVKVDIFLDHTDFASVLQAMAISNTPTITQKTICLTGDQWKDWVGEQEDLYDDLQAKLATNEKRYLALLKAALIASDVAGSIRVKQDGLVENWIGAAFKRIPAPAKIETIITAKLNGQAERDFQSEIAQSKARVTLVKAGCGSGKTIAAYAWAARRWPNRRLFFCYPTMGTSTEGFKSYLWDTIPEDSELIHGLSDLELEYLRREEHESTNIANSDDSAEPLESTQEQDAKDSIDLWATPIVCCTIDTVLGIMQNNRRGIYLWPTLAQSVFVFDEIHSFDDALFEALVRFIKDLPGLPCLLMTASLPIGRQKQIENALKANNDTLGGPIHGPTELEDRPRYQMKSILRTTEPPWAEVESAWKNGRKILWVVNTVKEAMNLYEESLARGAGLNPILYHSRYKYKDRRQRHAEVVTAFATENNGPVLAITTQVAEISLDLSAELLVTHVAPIPAMIQRLGRLNRRGALPHAPCMVYEPSQSLPYEKESLSETREWLELFGSNMIISQKMLVEKWEEIQQRIVRKKPAKLPMEWLDGLLKTEPRALRQASPSLDILLPSDAEAITSRQPGFKVEELRISMTIPFKIQGWKDWETVAFCKVPPEYNIDYCPTRGAQWKTSEGKYLIV